MKTDQLVSAPQGFGHFCIRRDEMDGVITVRFTRVFQAFSVTRNERRNSRRWFRSVLADLQPLGPINILYLVKYSEYISCQKLENLSFERGGGGWQLI